MQYRSPTIRAHLLRPYISAIEHKGQSVTRLLHQHGISTQAASDPYALIPLSAFLNFTIAAASLTEDALLGLSLGSKRRPEHVGALGLLLTTAPTFRAALTGFSVWVRGLQEGTWVELHDGRESADFTYRIEGAEPLLARQDVEFSLASICSLIRARMGASWAPLEIHFEHGSPGQDYRYEHVFKAPVYFNQPVNKLVFQRDNLDHVCLSPDHAMTPFIEHHLRVMSEDMSDQRQFAQRVSTAVARLIGERPVTLDVVAAELAMSVRSLQRRLHAEQVTFRDVVKSQRRRVAETLLRSRDNASVTEAAIGAGYADGTCLSRAFRLWTGTSPRQYARSYS